MKKSLALFLLLLPLLALCAREAADPLHYEIWVTLDPARKMLHGRETIHWTNTSGDTVPDICFHLYWNAFKNEKSTLMTEARLGGAEGPDHGDARVKDGDWGWIDVEKIRLKDGSDLKPAMEFIARDEPGHTDDQTVMRVKIRRGRWRPGKRSILNWPSPPKFRRPFAAPAIITTAISSASGSPSPASTSRARAGIATSTT